jgi:intracellular septation protein
LPRGCAARNDEERHMSENDTKKAASGLLNVVVDYGPLLVFLGVYNWMSPAETNAAGEIIAITYGTGAFMVAALIALGVSKWLIGRVSPMLWLSTGLIVVFGGFTIWTGDQRVIQAKPTVLYAFFGIALLVGYFRGRALLKLLLEAAFEGLSDKGWLKLSRNWGIFFLCLAALNEALVAQMDFEGWLWAKIWVFLPLTFLFTFSQIPMLLKYGLSFEDKDEVLKDEPPTG